MPANTQKAKVHNVRIINGNVLTGRATTKDGFLGAHSSEIQEGDVIDILHRHHLCAFAFSGIHTFSPKLFPLMKDYPDKFPIMDFYLQNADRVAIKGIVDDSLRLLDVGKLDTLDQAESFLIKYGC